MLNSFIETFKIYANNWLNHIKTHALMEKKNHTEKSKYIIM